MDTELTVGPAHAGERLDSFIAGATDLSRSQVKKLIDSGHVLFHDGATPKPSCRVEEHDVFHVTTPPREEPDFLPEELPLDIVYEDDALAVVNKPPGMVVHPGRGNMTGTLASGLLFRYARLSGVGGPFRPGIVHRLDKDTSGLLVVALDDPTHRALSRMLMKRSITRVYTAFVWGHPDPPDGVIEAPVGRHPKKPTLKAVVEGGRDAITRYETVAAHSFLSKLLVTLETGRTHQIRVHLAHMGHHVFGDPSYGGREERLGGFQPEYRHEARRLLAGLGRQALHAGRLAFDHPGTGERLDLSAPIPADMTPLDRLFGSEENV